jgi:hypothetical protein
LGNATDSERNDVAKQSNNTATWIIVVAAILLVGPLIWALSLIIDVVVAAGIGVVIFIGVVIWAFVWVRGRYQDKLEHPGR